MIPDLIEEVSLILFEVGPHLYGADATQVLRIDRPEPDALECPGLGQLARGDRALVFRAESGELQLKVDAVQGLRQVTVDQLRRVPPVAQASAYAMGFWLAGDTPILLVDLSESLKGGR